MSIETIVAGLTTVFQGVTDLTTVLDYVPRGIQTTPLLYTEDISTQYEDASDAVQAEYREVHRLKHRLVLSWQDDEQCEIQLRAFKDSIPAAVKADPKLSGALADGWARIVSAESGWMADASGNLNYRICDFYSEVWEV